MARPGGEERARLLCCRSLDAPFLDPRDQHPGVKQAGLGLGRGLGGRSGDA
jgi:hypothetical protein